MLYQVHLHNQLLGNKMNSLWQVHWINIHPVHTTWYVLQISTQFKVIDVLCVSHLTFFLRACVYIIVAGIQDKQWKKRAACFFGCKVMERTGTCVLLLDAALSPHNHIPSSSVGLRWNLVHGWCTTTCHGWSVSLVGMNHKSRQLEYMLLQYLKGCVIKRRAQNTP